MSGGHFDYVQFRINQAAEQLEEYTQQIINKEFEEAPEFSQTTIDKFQLCARLLHLNYKMLHHIDYLISGDYSEGTFEQIWQEEFGDTFTTFE